MCSGIDNNSIISQRCSFVKNKNIFLFEQQEKIPLYSFAELNSKKSHKTKKCSLLIKVKIKISE